MNKMKVILLTGDSHTWGQGATGLVDSLDPPCVAGELRPAPFCFASYASLVRQAVNARTHSTARELTPRELGLPLLENCGVLGRQPLNLAVNGLVRLVFRSREVPYKVRLWQDGVLSEINLVQADPANPYRVVSVFCDRLTLDCPEVEGLIYRAECYSGSHAVVNAGIGSCSIERFLAVYWQDYAAVYQPYLMVMEAHTINDWLTGESPETYGQRVRELIGRGAEMGAIPVLLTVAPIAGAQSLPYNTREYREFIKASRWAAAVEGAVLAEAHARMDNPELLPKLFSDDWHVNDLGHRIYADTVLDAIEPYI